ncbi:MAG: dTMP kinase [Gammaproteobacteria bacterium]|nr:dTMP kinase [Gammaproteobacteria bacterium]MBT8110894.1 dTMP kinase [Gammaproteobacteria bacterium]NND47076.1 dTMP kinase [Woeseiaceae bacterium]NNL45592.1 dTMP kinase [Woeseiaceae bacterium]
MERGKFITIEGIEGVGKSTNMAVLVERIEAAGHKVLTTREPGGTPMAEEIREILVRPADEPIPEIAELLLIFAARSLNVNNVIIPALDAGTWVVSDRFTDSSRAYQGGGRGIPMETIDVLADWVHGDAWPDLTILLDAPVEIGMQRAGHRGAPDRFEQERYDFFERVRECYLQLASHEPSRFVIIDTTRSLDGVKADIITLADQLVLDKTHS